MLISDITVKDVANFLRLDDHKDPLLIPMMEAAQAYIIGYTGMDEAELDTHDDLWLAYMVLVQDMYDNRAMYVEKDSVNKVVDSILFRHRKNFLPVDEGV